MTKKASTIVRDQNKEIPAPVERRIKHLENCIKACEKRDDQKGVRDLVYRLIAYKKKNGVV